jgi:hypothetical protein
MKSAFFLILAGLLMTSSAFCHLEESYPQCEARYGRGSNANPDAYGNPVMFFEKNGFDIFITFLKGKASKIQYSHSTKTVLGAGTDLSSNEADLLMQANYQGKWVPQSTSSMNDQWKSENSQFTAIKKSFTEILIIYDKDYSDFVDAAQEAKEKQNIKGM